MSSRFLLLWTAAVLATASAFVAHLSLRLSTVELGYEVGAARREQRQLIEERRLLSIEAATLREPDRVEAIARGTLGLDVPDPARVISIDSRRTRRPSGLMR